jgi:spore germination protein KA
MQNKISNAHGSAETFSFKIPITQQIDPMLIAIYQLPEKKGEDRFTPDLYVSNLYFNKKLLFQFLGIRNDPQNYQLYTDEALNLILDKIELDENNKIYILDDKLNKALININFYFDNVYNRIKNNLYNSKVKEVTNFKDLYYYLESGFTIIFINGFSKALAVETRETLDRGITDVKSEMGIKGPRDSFTENFNKNLGLIRKRIKDENLKVCEYLIGRRSKTKVGLLYIEDIAFIDNVNKIKEKLSEINIDAILDTGYIRDFLIEKKSIFPTIINSERPDLVCASLLEGKIAIIVENTPYVLVIPGFLNNFIHSSEDSYQKAIHVTFTRFLRLIALLITILVPAFYVAITTFNQEVIPDTLLISLAIQRSGVPFPTSFAVFIR